jgi:predicted MFS family arabinose efflux permease
MGKRSFFGRHYALAVTALIFGALLAAAGLRSTPGILMVPWEHAFGWSRSSISFAAATGIFLFGMTGPFAAAAMQRFGIRATVMTALAMMSLSTATSLMMTQTWHLVVTWGLVSGIGSGCITNVLSATIVNRWFVTHRGLVMGLFAASTSTGTLIFIPGLAAVAEHHGWQPVVMAVAAVMALLIPVVFFFLPEWPQDIGEMPFGADAHHPVPPREKNNPIRTAFSALGEGMRHRDFWLLAGTFFVCGFTTNGLIGTHMIAFCADNGMAVTAAGGLLAIMGVFDLVGTTASGWLTDRYAAHKLLFWYYGLRGLSLIYLPFADFSFYGLSLFAVIYGLDWIATVPPTVAIATRTFGPRKGPILFGWISASHQIGAASAAYLAGISRTITGSYLDAFVLAGVVAVAAAFASLAIGSKQRRYANL